MKNAKVKARTGTLMISFPARISKDDLNPGNMKEESPDTRSSNGAVSGHLHKPLTVISKRINGTKNSSSWQNDGEIYPISMEKKSRKRVVTRSIFFLSIILTNPWISISIAKTMIKRFCFIGFAE